MRISGNFWRRRSRRPSTGRLLILPSISPGRRIPARATSRKPSPSSSPGKQTPGYIFNLGKGVLGETAILAQLQAAAFKRERDGLTEEKVPTRNYCLIDECHNFVNHTTGRIAAETRKYGLSLILVQQFAGQEIEPNLFKTISTNTPLKFTGVGTAGTYESVAQSQQCDRESFYGLKRRRFHVSQRGGLPFIAAASPLLAGPEERMAPEEWAAFTAAQLRRWYAGGPREAAPGLIAVRGADPEEYEAPRSAGPALPPPPVPRVPSGGVAATGLFAGVRRTLGFKPLPVPSPPPAAPASAPPAAPPAAPGAPPPPPAGEGFEAEEEIAPGQFYARKKPKFAPP